MMYSITEDYSVYSVDQGYWFGSHEANRFLAPATDPAGKTQIPRLPEPIPQEHWDSAISTLENFDPETLNHIHHCIPDEWGVDSQTVNEMVYYAIDRIPYALDKLRRYQRILRS